VFEGSNGKLIATVARLGYLGTPTDTVFDVTYGRGSFWTVRRPPNLVTNDLFTPGVDMRADFRQLPLPHGSVRVLVFDPPYISTGNRETSSVDDFYDRFGLGEAKGWKAIRRDIDSVSAPASSCTAASCSSSAWTTSSPVARCGTPSTSTTRPGGWGCASSTASTITAAAARNPATTSTAHLASRSTPER
jgi:hypothetical protein